MHPRRWTIEEDNYIRKYFKVKSFSQMAKELNRTITVVQRRVEFLGYKFEKRTFKKWTPDEEELLKQLAPNYYIEEIAKALNRTTSSIKAKIKMMNIESITLRRKFSDEENEYIKNNYGIISNSEISRFLKVSKSVLDRQIRFLNIKKKENNHNKKWTKEKIEKLRRFAKTKTTIELAKKFKTTTDAITTVAYRNHIKLINKNVIWTHEEVEKLKEYAKTMDASEISKIMDKSETSIRSYASHNGITILKNKNKQKNTWTEEDSEKLKQLIKEDKTLIEIVRIINKSDVAILKKAKEFGLKIKKDKNLEWTNEEAQKLIILAKTNKLNDLVYILGKPSSSIRYKAKQLGLNIMCDNKRWSVEEIKWLEYLVLNEKKSAKEISELMNRSENAVINKINDINGLNQSKNKSVWLIDEELLLDDLWGIKPIEKIAETLNRSVSSIRNKAYELGLGSQIENNYEGLTIKMICQLFNVQINTVTINWVSLGLKMKKRSISQRKSYYYVEIKDLLDFLEKNQNIWDSRVLGEYTFGKEPQWLKEKRKNDRNNQNVSFRIGNLTKQQLILAKKSFLDYKELINESINDSENVLKLEKRNNNEGDK